jgi:2-phospho-L-lactate transferase/gluconeogenesis factor (CofD/UPF0052 family)
MAAPQRELRPAGVRLAAIAKTREAIKAHAATETARKMTGPGIHVLPMFKSALDLMERAHDIAKASEGEEITGESRALSAAEVEQVVEDSMYELYAQATGLRS